MHVLDVWVCEHAHTHIELETKQWSVLHSYINYNTVCPPLTIPFCQHSDHHYVTLLLMIIASILDITICCNIPESY